MTTDSSTTDSSADECPICGHTLRHAGASLRCEECEIDFVDNTDE